MDFWPASSTRSFKFSGEVPPDIPRSLEDAAATAARLDEEMERLHRVVHGDLPSVPVELARGAIPMPDDVVARLVHERGAFSAP